MKLMNRSRFYIIMGGLVCSILLFGYLKNIKAEEETKSHNISEAAVPEQGSTTLMFEYFDKGGSMMWGILFCSIVGFAIVIERGVKLRINKIIPPAFVESIKAEIPSGNITKAISLCEGKNFPVARIIKAGLLKHHQGISEVERAIETAGSLEMAYLTTNFGILRSAITMAPMLGFLGTVTGMIASFRTIATMGSSRPDLIADGIAEALITTAYGLLVAVPLMFIYQIYKGRVDSIVLQLQEVSLDIISELSYGGGSGAI
ncbi:MAG: MotA/TolQ/ExbB proton channel family protein [Candidatus Firestonebacteria bacterium]|nr:MotA/TolQ/ExbB proton channel family protein [Candidatus Firestonebacteria bacterium]